jgi:hypothetical protein
MDWNLAFLPFIPALPFVAGLAALFTRNRSLSSGVVLISTLLSVGLAIAVTMDRNRLVFDAELNGSALTAGQPHFEVGALFGGKISSVRLGVFLSNRLSNCLLADVQLSNPRQKFPSDCDGIFKGVPI